MVLKISTWRVRWLVTFGLRGVLNERAGKSYFIKRVNVKRFGATKTMLEFREKVLGHSFKEFFRLARFLENGGSVAQETLFGVLKELL